MFFLTLSKSETMGLAVHQLRQESVENRPDTSCIDIQNRVTNQLKIFISLTIINYVIYNFNMYFSLHVFMLLANIYNSYT